MLFLGGTLGGGKLLEKGFVYDSGRRRDEINSLENQIPEIIHHAH